MKQPIRVDEIYGGGIFFATLALNFGHPPLVWSRQTTWVICGYTSWYV